MTTNAPGTGHPPEEGAAEAAARLLREDSVARVPGTVDMVKDLLDDTTRVAVSVRWTETLEAIASGLEAGGVVVSRLDGRMSGAERDDQRQAFQQGAARVCVFSIADKALVRELAGSNDTRLAIHDMRPLRSARGPRPDRQSG